VSACDATGCADLHVRAQRPHQDRASYENLHDTRVATAASPRSREPVDVDLSTYFSNPADSHVDALVNLGYVTVSTRPARDRARNHVAGPLQRSYQNYAGAVAANHTQS
jgi:hypothetical protein